MFHCTLINCENIIHIYIFHSTLYSLYSFYKINSNRRNAKYSFPFVIIIKIGRSNTQYNGALPSTLSIFLSNGTKALISNTVVYSTYLYILISSAAVTQTFSKHHVKLANACNSAQLVIPNSKPSA